MAGPWEKYAQPATQDSGEAEGPWTKFQPNKETQSSDSGSFLKDAAKSTVDSLPMIGGVIGGILGTPADAVVGPLGNVTGAAIGGYLGTATKNLINRYTDPEKAPKTMTQVVAQPVVGGVEQGLMQGTGEAIAPYLAMAARPAVDATKWAGRKLLSSLGSVSPDVIKEYAQFSDRIKAAPAMEDLKQISDEFVGKLHSDVEAKNVTAKQAQDAYNAFHSDLKDTFKVAGYDARDAVTSAQQTLKDAHNARIQQLSGDLYDTVNKLKSDVQSGSSSALKVLDKANAVTDLRPTYQHIEESIAKLQQAGTDESLAVADKLQAYKDRLMSQHGVKISPPEAKKLIQGLDQVTEYSPMAGSFDKAKNSAFKGIRSTLDQTLKDSVPEYAKAMEPVAQDASLLNRVQDFGDKQSAAGILQRIQAPNQMERRAALQELGKKYDADFISAAKPESLPEHKFLKDAQANLESLRPDRVSEKIQNTLESSRLKAQADAAQKSYEEAEQKLSPFKPLAPNSAGQTQAQQKLEQLAKGKNIELEEMFKKLGQLTDTDFIQATKDHRILDAFKKSSINGSRNTVFGAIVGGVMGGLPGAAAGATAGRTALDHWAPAITKKILDGVLQVSKKPTLATIASLEVPDAVKKNMIIALENYMAHGGQAVEEYGMRNVADNPSQQNRVPAKGPDSWAQTGIKNLGIQDADLAQKLMQSKQGKQLLIQASDLKPGSKALQKINDQIQKGYGRK